MKILSAARAMATLSGVTSPRIRIAIPGLFVRDIRVNLLEGRSRHVPRERMAHHKVSVDAHLFPEFSNLVLKLRVELAIVST
jgi:hypothetical protein